MYKACQVVALLCMLMLRYIFLFLAIVLLSNKGGVCKVKKKKILGPDDLKTLLHAPHGQKSDFFLFELIKIYLIGRNVVSFEIAKKC